MTETPLQKALRAYHDHIREAPDAPDFQEVAIKYGYKDAAEAALAMQVAARYEAAALGL